MRRREIKTRHCINDSPVSSSASDNEDVSDQLSVACEAVFNQIIRALSSVIWFFDFSRPSRLVCPVQHWSKWSTNRAHRFQRSRRLENALLLFTFNASATAQNTTIDDRASLVMRNPVLCAPLVTVKICRFSVAEYSCKPRCFHNASCQRDTTY